MRTGLKVGFLNNQVDNRGTGNAIFSYADYNEKILGNKSLILTINADNPDGEMLNRLQERFGGIEVYRPWYIPPDIDILYHIKSGYNDGFVPPEDVRYVVHAVFNNDPHGDRYAFVSDWLANRFGGIAVPHILSLPDDTENLRSSLGLREDAIVFGRHGGADSFDLSFAWDTIAEASLIDDRLYFIFLNTNKPDIKFRRNNVIFLDNTADQVYKRRFINTCDAMIHARQRGETFGIAVGEFDICKKPVLTYGLSPEKAHYETLNHPITYFNKQELMIHLLTAESWIHEPVKSGYDIYDPESVMKRFYEVFLSK
jgi:hypothetical protein